MTKNSTFYISKTGPLYIKFEDMEHCSNVYRPEPVWPVENDMLESDWLDREIAEEKIHLIADFRN